MALPAGSITKLIPPMTAKAEKDDMLQSLGSGTDRYLVKPFKTKDLQKAIADCIDLGYNPYPT